MIYVEQLKIINFKSIEDQTISLNRGLNIIVGPNNAGKTNIIEALDLVLGDVYLPKFEPTTDHFFNGDERREIIIEVRLSGHEVSNLSWGISGNQVSVRYRFSENKGRFEVLRNGAWSCDENKPFKYWWGFENQLFFLRVRSLRNIMEITPIRWKSPLKYFKDSIIKQASRERIDEVINEIEEAKTKLGEIQEVKDIVSSLLKISKEQTAIKGISLSPSPTKYSDLLNEMKIFVDDGYISEVTKKGLGTQNSIIIALFRVMAKYIREQENKIILYGIDEPEIGLHPHAQRHLLKSLEKLADYSQVLITTHSSNLIDIYNIENILRIDKANGKTVVYRAALSDDQKKILEIHGDNIEELFFCKRALIVEGETEAGFFNEASKKITESVTEEDGSTTERRYSFDMNSVSVVNGQGDTVWRFLKVVNALHIPFLLLLDQDKISVCLDKCKEIRLIDQSQYDEFKAITDESILKTRLKALNIWICDSFESYLCDNASEATLRKIVDAINFVKRNWGHSQGIQDFSATRDEATLRTEVKSYLSSNKRKRISHAIAHSLGRDEYPSIYVEIIKSVSQL
jgi:predicted ATP-dependent endonuclease of OLD family